MNENKFKRRAIVSVLAGVWMVLPPGVASAATLLIQPGGLDASDCQASACQTIGYALTQAAPSGDTLQVAAGTYVEQLTINKSVTVQGAGSAATIIQAPSVLATTPASSPGSGGQQTAIVFVTGSTTHAAMKSLQVRGPGPSSSGSIGYGIFVGGNATFSLDSARVTAIRDEPFANSQNGGGVRFGAPNTNQVGSGEVLNSVIDDFQKNGITVSHVGSIVTLRGNTVTGTMPPPNTAQNGIQISGGAQALVENNTVSNLQCSPSFVNCGPNGAWSTGVRLSGAASATQVIGNRISHADTNLSVTGGNGIVHTIKDNEISDSVYANVSAEGVTLNMEGNLLRGGPVGLLAWGHSTYPTIMNLNGGNIITGATQGGIQAVAGAQPVSVSGSQNQFYGNAEGAQNPAAPPAVTLDLPCNWWGAPTGPTNAGNPLGTGNAVSGDVNYINWAINNTSFSCVGNPERNAEPPAPTPVPVNDPWALFSSALALAGLGAAALRARSRSPHGSAAPKKLRLRR